MKKSAASKIGAKNEELTYLDILPSDIKENILSPYHKQIAYDRRTFWGLIGNILVILNEELDNNEEELNLMAETEEILRKYGIELKFYRKEGKYKIKRIELPLITLNLLMELLKINVIYLVKVREDNIWLNDNVNIINKNLKINNIPLRVVSVGYESENTRSGKLEIVKIDIKYEIDN